MKTAKIALGIFLGFSVLSCAKPKTGSLSATLTGKNSYLIDASAQSCVNKMLVDKDPANTSTTMDISSLYFTYSGLTLSWASTENTAYIVSLKFEFPEKTGVQTCTIAGEELLAVFYDATTNTDWDGTIAKAADVNVPTTRASLCAIHCGGITVASKSAFSTMGTLTIKGFERTPAGEEIPIKTTASVKLMYE